MRKKYIFVIGFILIVFAVIIPYIMYIFWDEKTPEMNDVTNVYLEFVEPSMLWTGKDSGEYATVEITDSEDKNYLIDLFNNNYELYEFKCGCPCDDVKVIFETENTVYSYGVGVVGDGNAVYYNSGKYMGIPYEEYDELMEFFSKFDETADYYESNISRFR